MLAEGVPTMSTTNCEGIVTENESNQQMLNFKLYLGDTHNPSRSSSTVELSTSSSSMPQVVVSHHLLHPPGLPMSALFNSHRLPWIQSDERPYKRQNTRLPSFGWDSTPQYIIERLSLRLAVLRTPGDPQIRDVPGYIFRLVI